MAVFRGHMNKVTGEDGDDSQRVYEAAPVWPNMQYIQKHNNKGLKTLTYKRVRHHTVCDSKISDSL